MITTITLLSTSGAEKNLSKRDKDMPGLAYHVIELANKDDLVGIAERTNNRGGKVKWSSSNELTV